MLFTYKYIIVQRHNTYMRIIMIMILCCLKRLDDVSKLYLYIIQLFPKDIHIIYLFTYYVGYAI